MSATMIILFLIPTVLELVESCPSACFCLPYDYLTNCEGRNITRIPSDVPKYTKRLVLSSNPIKQIEDDDFKNLLALEVIIMKNTSLVSINNRAFIHLENLTALDFSHNKLRSIQKFSSLRSLKTLSLSNCQIEHLTDKSFSDLISLSHLRLDNNKITFLTPDFFSTLKNLSRLNLSNNSFAFLPARLFSSVAILETLDLSFNKLTDLDGNIFSTLRNLRTLLLNSNGLTTLKGELLDGLKNLRELSIYHNKLSFIDGQVFRYLPSITRIYMYGNLIPCGCQFFDMLKLLNRHIVADCLKPAGSNASLLVRYRKEKEKIVYPETSWSEWCSSNAEANCPESSLMRTRLCPDCSKKRFPVFCSHYVDQKKENSCIFIEGRKATFVKLKNSFKCDIAMNCPMNCKESDSGGSKLMALFIGVPVCVIVVIIFSIRECCLSSRNKPAVAGNGRKTSQVEQIESVEASQLPDDINQVDQEPANTLDNTHPHHSIPRVVPGRGKTVQATPIMPNSLPEKYKGTLSMLPQLNIGQCSHSF